MTNRFLFWGILAVVAAAVGIGIALSGDRKAETVASVKTVKTVQTGVSVGGAFELVDHHGEPVTEKSWGDAYKLVFFGFTYCPEICPLAMEKVTLVMETLPEDIREKVQPLFITTDPERDDAETVAEFVAQFHDKIIGLTGSREQVDAVIKTYRVYASKVAGGDPENYLMDHSSYIYLMGPEERLLKVFGSDRTADDVATEIKKQIEG